MTKKMLLIKATIEVENEDAINPPFYAASRADPMTLYVIISSHKAASESVVGDVPDEVWQLLAISNQQLTTKGAKMI